jgi:AraC-like DNA-binding protein
LAALRRAWEGRSTLFSKPRAQLPLPEVALVTGFADQSHLARQFSD